MYRKNHVVHFCKTEKKQSTVKLVDGYMLYFRYDYYDNNKRRLSLIGDDDRVLLLKYYQNNP